MKLHLPSLYWYSLSLIFCNISKLEYPKVNFVYSYQSYKTKLKNKKTLHGFSVSVNVCSLNFSSQKSHLKMMKFCHHLIIFFHLIVLYDSKAFFFFFSLDILLPKLTFSFSLLYFCWFSDHSKPYSFFLMLVCVPLAAWVIFSECKANPVPWLLKCLLWLIWLSG